MRYIVQIYRDVRQTKQVEIEIPDDSRASDIRASGEQLASEAATMPDYADGWSDLDVVDTGVESIGIGYL